MLDKVKDVQQILSIRKWYVPVEHIRLWATCVSRYLYQKDANYVLTSALIDLYNNMPVQRAMPGLKVIDCE